MINYVRNLQNIVKTKLTPFVIDSCTFDPLYNAPQILPCTSTLTHFTVPTNTAIYNYIVTARCSSPHNPIPLYLIKKLAITLTLTYKNIIDDSLITGTIPNLLKNAIISQ